MNETAWDNVAGRTGEVFEFRSPHGAIVGAQLVSAERAEHGPSVALTLTFRADEGIAEQGTYQVAHPEVGAFALFVVPRSPTQFDATITWLDAP